MSVSPTETLTERTNEQPPAVSIVIPTYQGSRYLAETLTAIRAQHYPASVEIIAVDSESTDNTRDLLNQFGAVVLSIPQRTFTHGYSRNVGVRAAQHPLIVFMSQDALPVGVDWLNTLVRALDDSTCKPAIGAVYARQIARPDATPLETYFHLTQYPARATRYRLSADENVSLDKIFFSNVCSAAHRDLCLTHPFDEQIIMSEDQAFALSLLKAGFQTRYVPEAQVIYSHPYDLRTLFRRNFDSAYSLRGITQDGWLVTIRKALSFIIGEVGYVIRRGEWRWLLRIPAYEAARISGRLLGRHADRLPIRWRGTLSLHRSYWTRESAG